MSHSLSMEKLKVEDLDSLQLDIEILNQEKAISEKDKTVLKSQLDKSQTYKLTSQQIRAKAAFTAKLNSG